MNDLQNLILFARFLDRLSRERAWSTRPAPIPPVVSEEYVELAHKLVDHFQFPESGSEPDDRVSAILTLALGDQYLEDARKLCKYTPEFREFIEEQKKEKMRNNSPDVQVVTAIIMRGDRIFMQQRSAHREIPFHWESPGGKVEPGEDPREALSRELDEELGVNIPASAFDEKPQVIRIESPLLRSNCTISFYVYMADESFKPECLDAMGMGWFTVEDILRFRELAPGNRVYFSRWGVSDLEAVAISLADFHAATAESEGVMSRTSKASKKRFYSICKKAVGMLESGTTAPYLKRDYANNKTDVISRLRHAMTLLGVESDE